MSKKKDNEHYQDIDWAAEATARAQKAAMDAQGGGPANFAPVWDALKQRDIKIGQTGQDYGKTSAALGEELMRKYYQPTVKRNGGAKSAWDSLVQQSNGNNGFRGSRWDSRAQGLIDQLAAMNFDDWTKGSAYKGLEERFTHQGQRAMDDTIGKIAARTGGLASSYAAAAGQQQYNEYMRDLEQVARSMFDRERDQLRQQATTEVGMADRDYERFLRQRDYEDQLRREQYGMERDKIGDDLRAQQYNDQVTRQSMTDAQGRIGNYFQNGGLLANLDQGLIEASRLTNDELLALQQSAQNQLAMQQQELALKQQQANQKENKPSGPAVEEYKPRLKGSDLEKAIESGKMSPQIRRDYIYWFGIDPMTGKPVDDPYGQLPAEAPKGGYIATGGEEDDDEDVSQVGYGGDPGITNQNNGNGVYIDGKLYPWDELEEKIGVEVEEIYDPKTGKLTYKPIGR